MLDNKVEGILCYRFEIFHLLDIVKIKLHSILHTRSSTGTKKSKSRVYASTSRESRIAQRPLGIVKRLHHQRLVGPEVETRYEISRFLSLAIVPLQ